MRPVILVCGGRNFRDYKLLKRVLDYIRPRKIIHGGAKGADTLADKWAKCKGVIVKKYQAEWKKYGLKAGPLRNQRMIDSERIDVVVAFAGNRGTADMVKRAKAAGLIVCEVTRWL